MVIAAATVLASASASASAAAAAPAWRQAPQHLPVDRQGDDGYSAGASAVDCADASYCVVVGRYDTDDPSLPQRVFLATEADGTRTSIAAPLPAGARARDAPYLDDVSCPVAGGCVAVGGYTGRYLNQALVETQVSGRWVPKHLGNNALDQVDCTPQICAASGPGEIAGAVFAVRNAAGKWSFPELTPPAGKIFSSVDDVACAGATCYALGRVYPPRGGHVRAVFLLPDGTGGYRSVYARQPAGVTDPVQLSALSCSDETTCFAIGEAGPGQAEDHLVIETLADGHVTVQQPHLPPAASSQPPLRGGDISCNDEGLCAATAAYGPGYPQVGIYHTGDLLLSRGSAGWHAVLARVPNLSQVSCAADRCVVAGTVGEHEARRGAFEVYQDGAWRAHELPLAKWMPSGTGVALYRISCSGDACLATGGFYVYDPEETYASQYGALLVRS